MLVYLKPIAQLGARGDRDRERHLYYDFEVHVLNKPGDEPSAASMVHKVDGYDHFHSTIIRGVRQEAQDYADNLGRVLGLTVEIGEFKQTFRFSAECIVMADTEEDAKAMFLRMLAGGEIPVGSQVIRS